MKKTFIVLIDISTNEASVVSNSKMSLEIMAVFDNPEFFKSVTFNFEKNEIKVIGNQNIRAKDLSQEINRSLKEYEKMKKEEGEDEGGRGKYGELLVFGTGGGETLNAEDYFREWWDKGQEEGEKRKKKLSKKEKKYLVDLNHDLEVAVREEDYEVAAKIRDEIKRVKNL